MTLTPSKIGIKVRDRMKLAKLQISLTIELCHLAAAVMTINSLPGLFLYLILTHIIQLSSDYFYSKLYLIIFSSLDISIQ